VSTRQVDSKIKLDQLLEGVRYRASIPLDAEVGGLATDSRRVEPGQVFACIEKGDAGESYISEALSRGVIAVLVEEGVLVDATQVVEVEHLNTKLSQLAGNYFGHPSRHLSVVGVTGTNGKSTVCSWIEQLLDLNGQAAGSIGTLGVHACGKQILKPDGMTTRDAVRAQEVLKFCKDAGAETVAMEVSSHGMHQHRVEAICFAVALFTNFSRDHLDYHQTELEYWRAKKRLFELPGIRCAVVNIDDAKGVELAAELDGSMDLVRFSIAGHEQADMSLSQLRFDQGFHAELKSKWGAGSIYLPQMTAEFELSNLLAALCAACFLGVGLEQALLKLADLQPASGRLQRVGTRYLADGPVEVYVDYAHTPDAVGRVLSALKATKATPPNQLIAILGCGGDRDRGKRPLMAKAALNSADQLIITSDNPRGEDQSQIERDMLDGVQDVSRVKCIPDRKAAIRFALENASANSCIAVLGKGHESGQIFADRVEPFNDIEVIEQLLEETPLSEPQGVQR
jgi:UDP-N-acetylmuramoyl-L-alanyl-D-glutamate--2,6-diaminopimelate ligase